MNHGPFSRPFWYYEYSTQFYNGGAWQKFSGHTLTREGANQIIQVVVKVNRHTKNILIVQEGK